MNSCHQQQDTAGVQVFTSVSSVIFSIIASFHHWIHMGILFILGGTAGMVLNHSAFEGLRKFMIIATFLTVIYTIYQLKRRTHQPQWSIFTSWISIVLSINFILYTLISYGW